MLFSITYISQATSLMNAKEILPLLKQSRAWNKEYGITGLLVYIQGVSRTNAEGRFIQILEGEEADIKELFYNKISVDKRHYKVTLLRQERIQKRDFSTWQMGFESINTEKDKELKGFFELDEQVLKMDAFHESKALVNFLKAFPAM